MGVAIKSKPSSVKPKPQVVQKPVLTPVAGNVILGYAEKVDRLAELTALLEPIKNMLKECSSIESELRSVVDQQVSADQPAKVAGNKGDYCVTERNMARTLADMKEVRKAMGDKLFMECARVTLTDLDKYLSKAEQAKVVTEARTGARRGELVLK